MPNPCTIEFIHTVTMRTFFSPLTRDIECIGDVVIIVSPYQLLLELDE